MILFMVRIFVFFLLVFVSLFCCLLFWCLCVNCFYFIYVECVEYLSSVFVTVAGTKDLCVTVDSFVDSPPHDRSGRGSSVSPVTDSNPSFYV